MRYIEVDGLRLSRIGLGTWQFGSREWGYGEHYAREIAPALLRRARDLGITMIDTAEAYGPARSERIIGAELGDLVDGQRDGLVVATKMMPIAPAEPIAAWQCAGSRRRLRMDRLDLYYIHWRNPFVSPRRVGQAVRPLLEAGHVRRFAVSNHSVGEWQAFERGLGAKAIANQVQFSLVSPDPEQDLVPYAAATGRCIVAWSPIGKGILAGRDHASLPRMRRATGAKATGIDRAGAVRALQAALSEVGQANGATPAQVALAWVTSHPNTVAIPGARTVSQLEENAAAADLVLADDEVARLGELAQPFRRAQAAAR
ncbi:MAG TPA: aldo/keto reductase [Candidatus Limnocylindrales bacterium]